SWPAHTQWACPSSVHGTRWRPARTAHPRRQWPVFCDWASTHSLSLVVGGRKRLHFRDFVSVRNLLREGRNTVRPKPLLALTNLWSNSTNVVRSPSVKGCSRRFCAACI